MEGMSEDREYESAIQSAGSFEELRGAIEQYGGLDGSEHTYSQDELLEQLSAVESIAKHHAIVGEEDEREDMYEHENAWGIEKECNLNYITSANGLRNKVIELVEQAGNAVDPDGTIHPYGKMDESGHGSRKTQE